MEPFFDAYLDRLQRLFHDVESAIADLPPDALDWTPGPKFNSVTVLVVHLAGSTRFWIGDLVGGDSSGRDRDREFLATNLSADDLRRLLGQTLDHARSVLKTTTVDDLDQRRASPNHEESFTVAWSLLHALEHAAGHVGQVQIMCQLWETRQV